MKIKIVLLLLGGFAITCYGDNPGSCNIDEINWDNNLFQHPPIQDVDPLEKIFTFTDNVEINGTVDSQFIDVTVVPETKQLIFKNNENFQNFDALTPKRTQTSITISANLELKCNNNDVTSRLTFTVEVQDTNNNDPVFTQQNYEYSVPMPMLPTIELTTLGEPIVATDVDFSNANVEFTIDPQDSFVLQTVPIPSANNKDYQSTLKVSAVKWLSEDSQFTITATDSGTPPRTGTTTLTIKVNKDASIPDVPAFSMPSYRFDYKVDENNDPQLVPLDGAVTITSTNPEKTTIALEANEYFEAVYDNVSGEVAINIIKPLDMTSENVKVFKLEATIDGADVSGKTVILINIPKENIVSVPKFSAPFYTAIYSTETDPPTVTVDGEIQVTENADRVTVELTGELKQYFTVTPNGNVWEVTVIGNLPSEVLDESGDVLLTLQATLTGEASEDVDPGYSTLIVKLPEIVVVNPPKFVKPYYSAVYSVDDDGTGSVALTDGPIEIEMGVVAQVEFESYSENFHIDLTQDPPITVLVPLDEAVLHSQVEILLVMKASIEETPETGSSVVVLQLPPVVTPMFASPSYLATYEKGEDGEDRIDTVKIDGDAIIFATAIESPIIKLTGSHSDSFSLVLNPDQTAYEIQVVSNLDDTVLEDEIEVVLTIHAQAYDTGNEGITVVVINLPKEKIAPSPAAFSLPFYPAEYIIQSDPDEIQITDSISLVGEPQIIEQTAVALTGELSIYFELEPLTGGKYNIKLHDELPEDVIKGQTEVVIVLEATLDGSPAKATAPIVIEIPAAIPAPKFTDILYTAKYEIQQDQTHTITLNDDQKITIEGDTTGATTINVLDPYQTNFKVEFNSQTQIYEISVIDPLSEDILTTNSEIIIALEAVVSGAEGTGSANILVALPPKTLDVVPTFSAPFYAATYTANGEVDDDVVTLSAEILITSDYSDQTTVQVLGIYADNFLAEKDGDGWKITVKKDLDQDTLNREKEIVVTLDATLTGSDKRSSAVLLINLPNQDLKPAPKFVLTYYTAVYNDDDTVTVTSDPIAVAGASESEVTVTWEGTYAEYFQITHDETNPQWNLVMAKPLIDTILQEEKEIILELKATLENAVDVGTSTLLIKLPEISQTIITFNKPFYMATYTVNEGEPLDAITVEDITISEASATVAVTGEYGDKFAITCGADLKCQLSLTGHLTEEVLKTETEIAIALEASKDDESDKGTATVIISLPLKETTKTPHFTEPAYTATYTLGAGTDDDTIALDNGLINIEGNIDVSQWRLELSDYQDTVSITKVQDGWELGMLKDLPADVIEAAEPVVLKILAISDGSSNQAVATLVIKLPVISQTIITFDKPFYMGTYTVNEGAPLDTISVEDITISEADVTVVVTGGYENKFAIICGADLKCQLSVKENLTDDVLKTETEIAIVLEASKNGESDKGTTTVIISLPLKETTKTPHFTEPAYTATYTLGAGTDLDTIALDNGLINIEGNIDVGQWRLELSDYQDTVSITKVQDGWELSMQKNFPADVIEAAEPVVLKILAISDGSSNQAVATLVIKLPQKQTASTITFSDNYYIVDYVLEDGAGSINVEQDITVEGEALDQVVVSLNGDNSEHFNAVLDPTTGKVELTLESDLPSEILDGESAVITFNLAAAKDTERISASIVVKLPQKVVTSTISFSENVYLAEYIDANENDAASFVVEEDIVIEGETADLDLSKITLEGEYSENFERAYDAAAHKVSITLKTELPGELLDGLTAVISITLKAEGAQETASATIVIKLPKKVVAATIKFSQVSYMAKYEDDALEVDDDIEIEGDSPEAAQVEITGDNKDYFNVVNDGGKVSVTLEQKLPDDVLEKETVITLTIQATKGTETILSSLVIALPQTGNNGGDSDDSSGDNQDGLIAAVVVLALLLVAALVGSAAFYYFRIRKRTSGGLLEETPPAERFTKHSTATDINKFDHPTRRPTGVIRYPLYSEEGPEETTTDYEEPTERRKSVAFDENVEELEIESGETDDDFIDLEQNDGSSHPHEKNTEL